MNAHMIGHPYKHINTKHMHKLVNVYISELYSHKYNCELCNKTYTNKKSCIYAILMPHPHKLIP